MNLFQKHLLLTIAGHPGINRAELALALGVSHISNNHGRYLRVLESRGAVVSMFVCEGGKRRVKVYRSN